MPGLVATTTGGVGQIRRRWHRCPPLGRAPRSSPLAAERGAAGAGLEGGAPRPREASEGHASDPVGHCPTDRVPTFTADETRSSAVLHRTRATTAAESRGPLEAATLIRLDPTALSRCQTRLAHAERDHGAPGLPVLGDRAAELPSQVRSSSLLPNPPGPVGATTRRPPRSIPTTAISPSCSEQITPSVPRARDTAPYLGFTRLHSGLGYLTPNQKAAAFHSAASGA